MDATRPHHPSYRELLLLTLDELAAERAEAVREHLLDCAVCLAQTRELLRLPETPPLPEMAIGEEEQEAAWQRLSATLDADKKIPPALVPAGSPQPRFQVLSGGGESTPSPEPKLKHPFNLHRALLTAALLAAAIGFGRWGLAPSFEPTGAVSQFGIASKNLRGDPEPPWKVDCSQDGGNFVWVAAPSFDSSQLPPQVWGRVLAPDSRPVADLKLPVNRRGEVVFLLQRSDVPNGTYLVQIFLEKDGRLVGERNVAVHCP